MWKQVFKTVAIAGCLDISAAFIQAYLSAHVTPAIVLQYIASGLFGNEAFAGTAIAYEAAGLLAHFFIVFACTICYFLCYTRLAVLRKGILLSAFLVALVAWVVTTQIIIPPEQNPAFPL